ncbi:uncharacterized protein [Brachionichthys hirsutus]|uniref:uncharacterized protein isoform X1 n=1 Tax=Brachionichthys hirsutus TaxID=412623 RepID=UPI0036046BFF
MGLEVDEEDIDELIRVRSEELSTKELRELEAMQRTAVQEEFGDEEEEEEDAAIVPPAQIKDILAKFHEVSEFVEKNHPEKVMTSRAIAHYDDVCLAHFRRIVKSPQKQTSLDRFFKKRVKPLLQEQEEIKARDELMKVKERLLKLENELVEVKRKHRQLKASRRAKTKPPRQDGSVEYQVDVPETSTTAVEKPDLQYVVDEEAILQLMKNCPVCNRKCRCSKYTHGSYFIVNQSCYSCHYRRKWASQPGASAIRRPSRRAKVRA